MCLQLLISKVAIVLIASVNKDGHSCFGNVMFLQFCHLPALLGHSVSDWPNDVDGVLQSSDFGAHVSVEVVMNWILIILAEEEVLHH